MLMKKYIGVFCLAALALAAYAVRVLPRHDNKVVMDFTIEEVGRAVGLTYQHKMPSLPNPILDFILRFVLFAPGIAVADFNNDGYMDIFVPNTAEGAENHLYINQGGKTFAN